MNSKLVGKYFRIFDNMYQNGVKREGKIISEEWDGMFFIELYGEKENEFTLFSVKDMKDWKFYDHKEEMEL